MIKSFINATQTTVTYHDGTTDQGCQYHTKHLHILTAAEKHVSATYQYKKLCHALQKKNINVTSQKIYKLQGFADYMSLNPRIYLGSNDAAIMKLIPAQHDKDVKIPEPTTNNSTNTTKAKPNKLYQDIQDLIKIMHEYKTSEKDDLYKLTRDTKYDDRHIELYRSNNWNRMYPSAKEEFTLQNQLCKISSKM